MKKRLNRDAQEERVSELRGERAQVRDILEAEASHSDKETTSARLAEIDEELARLETQIEESEAAMPLRERIKEIFKENDVTLTAILLAIGVTIGAVVGALTNALKAIRKALGNGFKEVGSKVDSILPGLIGSIASFLFKTARQAIGYLAEHTWLLILAAVSLWPKSTSKSGVNSKLYTPIRRLLPRRQ